MYVTPPVCLANRKVKHVCGIGGCINRDAAPTGVRELVAMQARLEHRGPDSAGLAGWDVQGNAVCMDPSAYPPAVALLHTRLSIIDLSDASNQPMGSSDGRYSMVFNGEIYNYRELRSDLEAQGYHFATTGDSEVLLVSYIEWGAAALDRLVGMFAFAVLDWHKRILFAARDPFGIKPLYYANSDDGFAFASEIKALLELGWVGRAADAETLQRFLRFGGTEGDERTMFRDVRQLPAGCHMQVPLDETRDISVTRYWRLPNEALTDQDISFEDAAREVRALFLESVALHMRSDVPIGSALSGGIDSSAIVMAMRQLGGQHLDLHTFSYIADDKSLSEEPWIDLVNEAAGANAHKLHVGGQDFIEDLDRSITAQDEPLSGTSLYAQYCVFKASRDAGIPVMLDGQGGDELLAGYRPYLGARMASLLRSGSLSAAVQLARSSRVDSGISALSLLQDTADHVLTPRQQAPLRRLLGKEMIPSWVNGEWFASRARPQLPPHHTTGRDVLRQSLHRDAVGGGLASLLRYEDRNSMAWSVESRVPFLMPKLATFLLSLPEQYLIDERGRSKAVFREAMRGIMPDVVADRRDKLGFATPSHAWLASDHRHIASVVRRSGILDAGFLKPRAVVRLIDQSAQHASASGPLWRLYFLARWTEQYRIGYP